MVEMNAQLAEKVATACNILAMGGHSDLTLGHVTARESGQFHLHMKPRGLGLDEITAQDIILIDLDGKKLAGSAHQHLEYPIHTEVYKMYPDINCVIHTHPFYSIILASTGETIKAISHEGALFADIPIYTETAMLINTPELGRAVARALNGHNALLMRHHGVLVVGKSIEEATIDALLLEKAAKFQVMASMVGTLITTPSEEILPKREQLLSGRNVKASWDYCVRKLRK